MPINRPRLLSIWGENDEVATPATTALAALALVLVGTLKWESWLMSSVNVGTPGGFTIYCRFF